MRKKTEDRIRQKPGRGGGRLTIMRLSVKRINPAAYNPRKDLKPGDPEYEALVRSIDAFGYVDPLIWNRRSGNLVGGHQRFKVLLARGVKRVDVSVVDLGAGEEKALNLALNKVKGDWDQENLAALLKELQAEAAGGGIDAAISGFSAHEIERICQEGDRLVELLVPKEDAEEEEEQQGEGGAGKKPHLFQVVVKCPTAAAQRKLHRMLTGDGMECEMRTY